MAMMCSSSFAVLLALLTLGAALVTQTAAGRPWGSRPNYTTLPNAQDDDDEVDLTIPAFLLNSTSPLDADAERVRRYAAAWENHTLSQDIEAFCRDANLMCNPDVTIDDPWVDMSRDELHDEPFLRDSITNPSGDDGQGLQFGEMEVMEGKDVVLPESLHWAANPSPAFLPDFLVEKMPLSSEKIQELLDIFHISHGSKLANMMFYTIHRCEEETRNEIAVTKEKEMKEKEMKEKEMKEKEMKEKEMKEKEIGHPGEEKKEKQTNLSIEKEVKEKETTSVEHYEKKKEIILHNGKEIERSSSEQSTITKEVKKKSSQKGNKKEVKKETVQSNEKKIKEKDERKVKGKEIEKMEKKNMGVNKEKSSDKEKLKFKETECKEVKEKEKVKKTYKSEKKSNELKHVTEREFEYNQEKEMKEKDFHARSEKILEDEKVEEKEIEHEKKIELKKKKKSSEKKLVKEKEIEHKKEIEVKKEETHGREEKSREVNYVKEKQYEYNKEKHRKEDIYAKEEERNKKKKLVKKETKKFKEGRKVQEKEIEKRKEMEMKQESGKSTEAKLLKGMKEKEKIIKKEESSKEIRKCVTSLEGMTSFVKKSLPNEKHIKALERSTSTKLDEKEHTKIKWKVLILKKYEKAVVCKNSIFLFAVYECHDISKIESKVIYHIELEGIGGVRRTEILACEGKNKYIDSIHAKDKLKSTMKVSCQWVKDALVWAPNS